MKMGMTPWWHSNVIPLRFRRNKINKVANPNTGIGEGEWVVESHLYMAFSRLLMNCMKWMRSQ